MRLNFILFERRQLKLAKQFAIMLEFDDNKKNSRLTKLLNSKTGKSHTLKRTKDKALITEALFDSMQMEIEIADVDFVSLVQVEDSKMKAIVKDAELMSPEYDAILRRLRYERTFV